MVFVANKKCLEENETYLVWKRNVAHYTALASQNQNQILYCAAYAQLFRH